MKTSRAQQIDVIRQLCSPLQPEPTTLKRRIRRMPELQAVIFDCYGTLFISQAGDISNSREVKQPLALVRALRAAGYCGDLEKAGRQGLKLLFDLIYASHEHSRSAGILYPEIDIRHIWHDVLNILEHEKILSGSNEQYQSIERLAIEYEYRVSPAWPMPGLADILHCLSRKSIRCGIISNAQFHTQLLFEALLGTPLSIAGIDPDLCVWSYECMEAKPSPKLFLQALDTLEELYGISPKEVLCVGNDVLNDLITPTQLDCKTALFAGDQRSLRLHKDNATCRKFEPDAIIKALGDIAVIIENS